MSLQPALDIEAKAGEPELISNYRRRVNGIDEMLRLPQELLASELSRQLMARGQVAMNSRDRTLRRLIRQDGVSYGGSIDGKPAKPWQMDVLPVIITAAEWRELQPALAQRARLLDAMLRDIYGPRTLIRDGIIPAHILLGHSGFRPVYDGIALPSQHQLIHLATDLVRGTDGKLQIISDRVQAPSGVAYALANRRLVARTLDVQYRFTTVHRLSGFYDAMREAYLATAPAEVDRPRAVLLSAGPGSETAFDQALLASLLGFPIVQASDLVMQAGRIYLRSTGKLQQIDVLIRRVDAAWSDSLELRGDSKLGVAGLLQAARSGRLSVVNPLGAGVLENPGLIPYLDAAARHLLDEDLLLSSPTTWWCGEPAALDHVIKNIEQLIIKPISGDLTTAAAGWQLDSAARTELIARIQQEPWRWAAQEHTRTSTAPVVTADGFEPRPVSLRTFAVSHRGEYQIMPGGLARVAGDPADWQISNATGALSKDVWVLEDTTNSADVIAVGSAQHAGFALDARVPDLPPSSADDLYWFGRYLERTEATARLLSMAMQAVEDNHFRPDTPGHQAMRALLDAMSTVAAIELPDFELTSEFDWLNEVASDPVLPGSLRRSAERAASVADSVRELISVETAGVVAAMLRPLQDDDPYDMSVASASSEVLQACLAAAGLSAESTVRDPIWAFTEAGRRMERSQLTISLLRSTLAIPQSPVAESLLATSVLRAGDSLITHDRRLAAGIGSLNPAEAAVELLLFDSSNPRSVQYQLDRLVEALELIQDDATLATAVELSDLLRGQDHRSLYAKNRGALQQLLTLLGEQTRQLSDDLAAANFIQPSMHSFNVIGEQEWA